MTKLEALEKAEAESPADKDFEARLRAAESPEDIADPFGEKELEKRFDRELSEKEAEAESAKDSFEETGRRRVRRKTKYTPLRTRPWQDLSTSQYLRFPIVREANPNFQTCFHNGAEKHFRFPAKIFSPPGDDPSAWRNSTIFRAPEWPPIDVPFEIFSVPGCTGTDARFRAWLPSRQFRRLPVRLPSFFTLPEIIDDTEAAAFNRAKIAVYDAEFPQSKFPEHKIFGRASRNASPQYDAETLKSLGEYIDLHGSTEPLQSNFMVGQRSQEMEMRPSPEEMQALWNDGIEYEVRTISTAPPLSQCGYATPFYSLMKIPVSGAVKYWVAKKNVSEDKLQRRRGNEGVSQEKIDSEIKQLRHLETVGFKNRGREMGAL